MFNECQLDSFGTSARDCMTEQMTWKLTFQNKYFN